MVLSTLGPRPAKYMFKYALVPVKSLGLNLKHVGNKLIRPEHEVEPQSLK